MLPLFYSIISFAQRNSRGYAYAASFFQVVVSDCPLYLHGQTAVVYHRPNKYGIIFPSSGTKPSRLLLYDLIVRHILVVDALSFLSGVFTRRHGRYLFFIFLHVALVSCGFRQRQGAYQLLLLVLH
jgi:hypothetical protein